MSILKQSLIFDEALRDSPLFKAYLKGYEDRMERFEDGVAKVAQACEELSRVQSSINRFRMHFTTAFKAMSEDLICDRVLKNTVDVLNDLMESICGDIFSALQEMREHVLEAMTDIFKMHIQKIDDKKKQYYSRYDFFESNLVKGVASSPFNDASRQPSESTANSRLAFKHSALELARVFNVFRIDFREQILNSFARIVKCVTGLSYKMNDKTKQIRPDIETVSSLISRALMEYKEEKDYISHRYEVYRRKCSAAMIEDTNNMSSSTVVATSGAASPAMVLAPSLPCLTSCNIIILQGYLMKQPRTKFGPWSRRWFYLVDDRLLYYRTKESDFRIVTDCLNKSWLIRGKKDDKRQNLLELQGPADSISGDSKSSGGGSGKHTSMLLQAESRAESSLWQDVIFSTIQNSSSNSSPRTSYLNSSSSSELVLVDTIIKPDFNHASTIEETARLEENKFCCECSALDPCWGVTAFGITVCSSCAAVHKMAIQKFSQCNSSSPGGTGRVLSLTLDEWRPEVAAVMKLLGNRLVNSIYEAHRTNELEKPRHDSDMMTREKWIFGKYLERRFVRPLSDSQSFDPSQKLFSAVSSESCDVGLLLQYISQGADVNWRSEQNDSMTPLHNATYGGKLTCCELLIQQGAEVDSRDKQGRTPLHFACINSNRMVACLLLNHGADPHALDVEEKTPMDIATDAQDRDLRCILKISQALRKFQPNEEDNDRNAANAGNFRLSRAPTNASNYRGFNTER